MSRLSSSTSSSDPDGGVAERRSIWRRCAWVLAWLVALDIAASIAFAFPADPRDLSPSRWALYFDYGRSMEGRLRRGTRADPEQTAPITLSGWYRPLVAVARQAKAPDGTVVHFYGMSHAVRLADALQATSATMTARSVGAPGATANWAFGAFRRDTGRHRGDVAVLALMSTTLPMITTMSPMTWNSSFAMPYTADRYRLRDGRLVVTRPPYDSFAGYVATFDDPARWAAAKRTFAANDPFFDPRLFDETVLDHSSLVRLLRRAWAQKRDREERAAALDETGFVANSEAVRLANGIVAEFAREARREGVVPVVYVVNNLGFGDHLFRALEPALRAGHIPVLNSAAVIDPRDAAWYLPDTHFTDEGDRRLARALERIIREQQAGQGG
ncbi:MAG TPA: hypothetical protein VFS49_03750 [Croceibacterium sp.]|nr:hypothetical protein [Croceibacterium sp.]